MAHDIQSIGAYYIKNKPQTGQVYVAPLVALLRSPRTSRTGLSSAALQSGPWYLEQGWRTQQILETRV